jgi:hypothetical protein
MADPVTLGFLAATALSMGAEAVVKTAVGEVVKDAYKGLKDVVSRWAGGEVAMLEAAPNSKGKQLAVAEIIDGRAGDEKAQVKRLALALNEALRNAAKAGVIGIDIGRLEADNVRLGQINVSAGVGFSADEVKVKGDFTVDSLTVGKPKR